MLVLHSLFALRRHKAGRRVRKLDRRVIDARKAADAAASHQQKVAQEIDGKNLPRQSVAVRVEGEAKYREATEARQNANAEREAAELAMRQALMAKGKMDRTAGRAWLWSLIGAAEVAIVVVAWNASEPVRQWIASIDLSAFQAGCAVAGGFIHAACRGDATEIVTLAAGGMVGAKGASMGWGLARFAGPLAWRAAKAVVGLVR